MAREQVERMNAILQAGLREPATIQRLAGLALEPIAESTAETARFIAADVEKNAALLRFAFPAGIAVNVFLRVSLPLAAVGFINQASRTVVATVGPVMALEFGLSASGLGALAAIFFAAYALAQLPIGLAIDLHGARRVQTVLALVAAIGFATCALAPDPGLLAIGRFVTGLGIAGALIGLMKANSQWYPPQRLPAVNGVAVFIGAAGGLAATVPVQALLPLAGWRGIFLGLAALAALIALWVRLSVPLAPPGPGRRSAAGCWSRSSNSAGSSATRSSPGTCRRSPSAPAWSSPTRGSGPGPGCATSAGWKPGPAPGCCCSIRSG